MTVQSQSKQGRLPDLRFVYRDWGGPIRARGYDAPPCRRGHRWTIIAPEILRATRAGGLSRPTWYCGPTHDPYCERCGVYRDQDAARWVQWRVWTVFAAFDLRLAKQEEGRA